ncbi:MAG: hypothetical protein BWY55_00318 [archaeon ADurb.Bin336]|nr:MAG: hypothetical protein BWY55_00318 [archaeon ADurb.Bin336]
MDKRQLVIESIKKLLALNVTDSEIIDNLSDVGLSKEEAIDLIKEAKGINNNSSPKKEEVKAENVVKETNDSETKSSSKEVFDDTLKKLSMNDQVISQIPFVKKDSGENLVKKAESVQESNEKMVGDVADQSLKASGVEVKEKEDLSNIKKIDSSSINKGVVLDKKLVVDKKLVDGANKENESSVKENAKNITSLENKSTQKIDVKSSNIKDSKAENTSIESKIEVKSSNSKDGFSGGLDKSPFKKTSGSINLSENKSGLGTYSKSSSLDFGLKTNKENFMESFSKNDFSTSSESVEELWKKGIVVAVNTKLAEMKQLKEDVDLKIDQSVDEAVRKELHQMKVLMDSQKELLISSNKEALEQKQKEITFIIDSKIAELKQYNKYLSDNLKVMEEIKKQQQESTAEIKSALEDAKKTKAQLLIEVNSELIKTKSQAQAFLDSAANQMNQMDVRVNKTLELEKNIAEGMLSQAEQKIEQLTIARADDLIRKLEVELNKLQATNKRISPELLDDKIKTLDKFRLEFVNSMQKSLNQINDSIEELNKKNEFAQKTFEEKSLEIDAKIEALTKFENQFTQIIENVLDKHK